MTPQALERLQAYAWPGNVRELENVIERAVVLAQGPVIGIEDLPPELQDQEPVSMSIMLSYPPMLPSPRLNERLANAGSMLAIGRLPPVLDIGLATLYRKLKSTTWSELSRPSLL